MSRTTDHGKRKAHRKLQQPEQPCYRSLKELVDERILLLKQLAEEHLIHFTAPIEHSGDHGEMLSGPSCALEFSLPLEVLADPDQYRELHRRLGYQHMSPVFYAKAARYGRKMLELEGSA